MELPAYEAVNSLANTAEARQATVAAAGAPVRIIYGRASVGAQIFAVGTLGTDLVIGCMWGRGVIDAVESLTINGQSLAPQITVTHYLGQTTQAVDATLAAAIPGYSDTLVTSVAGQAVGMAYSVLRIPRLILSGWPRVTAMVRGLHLFDPRTSTTGYSANAGLALRDFLSSPIHGQGLTVEDAGAIAVANACDELLVDGSKRRTLNLVIDSVAPVPQWADVLRGYAGCFVNREGSVARLVPDRPAAPVRAVTLADIVGGDINVSRRGSRDMPTLVRVKYTDTTTTPWRDAEAVAKLAGVDAGTVARREETISLPGIDTHAQAYREAVERLNRAQLCSIDADWQTFDEGIKHQIGDVITLTHPLGLSAQPMRITNVELVAPGRWRVSASEYDANVYSDSIQGSSWADSALPSPDYIAPPTVAEPESGTAHLLLGADGTITSRMYVTFTPPTDIYYSHCEVEFKKSTESIWTNAPVSTNSAYCTPVVDRLDYHARVRAVNSFGVASAWVQVDHIVIGKTEPPPPVDSFSIARNPDGSQSGRITYGNKPLDFKSFTLFVDGLAVQPGIASLDFPVLAGPINTPGTYNVAIVVYDTSDNASAAVSFNYTRPVVPVISDIAVTLLQDGNHLITLSYPNKPIDFASFTLYANGQIIQAGVTTLEFICKSSAIKNYAMYTMGIVVEDKVGNVSAMFTKSYTRPAVTDVTGFAANIVNDEIVLTNVAVTDIDLLDYETRLGSSWSTATVLLNSLDIINKLAPLPAGSYTFLRKARNKDGNYSATAASAALTIQLPATPLDYLITRDADGTRRFTWKSPTKTSYSIAGYKLRYKLGSGHLWANMSDLHGGLLTSSPYETNQLSAGNYTFAIATVDAAGQISDPVYIEATIGDPRLAGALDIITPHLENWSGTLTDCWRDPQTGWLYATDAKGWADMTSWSGATNWTQAPKTLVFVSNVIDIGLISKFTPLISAEYVGNCTLEYRISNDNVSWSAWAAPSGLVTARYTQARATVAPPSATNSDAILKTLTYILSATPVTEDVTDLSTATLTGSYRIGTGDVRIPITQTYSAIRKIEVALQNVGAGWSWEVIDKNTSPGPRIKIYNASNVLADAVIDVTIRGV